MTTTYLRAGGMAKGKGGRPPKAAGDQGTRHVRLFEDIVEMVSWIIRVEGGSSAQLLDPLVRTPVQARFEKVRHLVDEIKAAEKKAADWQEKRKGKGPAA